MDAAPKAYYEEGVFPEVWDLPTPPVKIRIPEGFDPTNPAHVEAAQQTYQKAYDMGELGKAAQKYIGDIEAKNVEYAANNTAVAEYSQRIKRLEDEMKRGTKPETSGIRRFFNTEGNPDVPLTAKDYSAKMIALDAAKKGLASAEQKLKQASETPSPTVYEVQLPQPAKQEPPTESKVAPQEQQPALPSKASLESTGMSEQESWYRRQMDRLGQWTQQQIAGGADPSKVRAAREMYMADIENQWVPEIKRYGGKTWRLDAPNKHVEVSNDAAAVKEPFTHSVQKATDQISNVDQINEMIATAEKAASTKDKNERNTLIAGLQNSFKAITTGISGTSDAVQQQEFARANAPLEAWNLARALDPNSLTRFGKTNPQGFADMLKAVRNISISKAAKHFVTAEDIAKEFPMYKPALPSVPEYMQQFMQQKGQGQVIERGQPAAQQGTQVISKGGSPYIIKKAK